MFLLVHEMLHALGFYHMQSSRDRDNFVQIFWDNINPNQKDNFYVADDSHHYGQRYDYDSIMHYSSKAFSINNRATILPKVSEKPNATEFLQIQKLINHIFSNQDRRYTNQIGQRTHLSSMDIKKINRMYRCQKRGRAGGKKYFEQVETEVDSSESDAESVTEPFDESFTESLDD